MIHAYDEMYVEGTMIRLGDMLEYTCLDCGYALDCFWKMVIQSHIAMHFEIGNVIIAGKSGLKLAYMIMYDIDHKDKYPSPTWRKNRSDIYWCGWILAYFQWYRDLTFVEIWNSISICMLKRMYPTLYEIDILKVVDIILSLTKKCKVKTL